MRSFAAVLAFAAATAFGAPPLPPPVATDHPGLRMLGEGTLRFFGIHVYDGSVWIPGDNYSLTGLFALELRYAISVKGAELASQSVKEWKKQGMNDESKFKRWEAEMTRIFPDIKSGDRLVGVHLPGKGAAFYSADKALGMIADPEFADAFFGIWLSDKTSEPKLRAQMLKLAD